MADRVELIGVGDLRPDGDDADLSSAGELTTHVIARRKGLGPGTVFTIVALAVLGLIVLLGPVAEPETEQPSPREQVLPEQTPRVDPPDSPSAPPAKTGWSAPASVPVAPAAEGVTLIVGRGVEKTFISLGRGTKTVVDVEGVPVAGAPGFVALSAGNDRDVAAGAAPDCWFSIADRDCRPLPSSIDPVADVDVFDETAVRSLTAVTADGRWEAGWRAGQLFVTDRHTGADTVVPDIRRSYFDDALVLVG